MEESLKDKKRKSWGIAIAIHQINGWQPDDEFEKLIEKEINGKISTEDIINITIDKYKK